MNTQSTALKTAFFQHCYQRSTGTIFISTPDNRSAQVVLNDGIVQGANYVDQPSYDALNVLLDMEDIRFSFNAGLLFPVRIPLSGSQSITLLEEQGYMGFLQQQALLEQEQLNEADAEPEKTADEVRYYRGQVVQKSRSQQQDSDTLTGVKPQSVRIYRGQKVYV